MGRHAGTSSTERAFRKAFADALRNMIGNERGGASRAAAELRTSRQAISLYLKEKATPSAELVRRAIKAWNLKMDVDGYVVSESSYIQKSSGPIAAEPLQLSLLSEALDSINDENVKVKIVQRIGDSIALKVNIDFGNARKRS